ncbi:hypothetical protein phiAS5_ORF0069 [Aeromonas phage phiAS5]|uniref:Uncharacterized protein n=1 Tax=Aeromonas phage phiAS5 TaxID=879630 RepID=E1A2G6_9CAUD|nr:hypothetical protein phiAS5_ORF0069 [Aeromonas phage phiAS5]ADM79912.1 hypothetical protein phiAS5_ORF0069 [Aeromonas phage phiAS5]BES53318.1 hypothetical protein [Aeromonas phage phiWae14]
MFSMKDIGEDGKLILVHKNKINKVGIVEYTGNPLHPFIVHGDVPSVCALESDSTAFFKKLNECMGDYEKAEVVDPSVSTDVFPIKAVTIKSTDSTIYKGKRHHILHCRNAYVIYRSGTKFFIKDFITGTLDIHTKESAVEFVNSSDHIHKIMRYRDKYVRFINK